MARDCGAKKVFFASAAPPVRFPNVYGIDMPTRSELIATGRDAEQIAAAIGADAVYYQSLEDLVNDVRACNPTIQHFDASCFNGEYITGVSEEYLAGIESQRSNGETRGGTSNTAQLDLGLSTVD